MKFFFFHFLDFALQKWPPLKKKVFWILPMILLLIYVLVQQRLGMTHCSTLSEINLHYLIDLEIIFQFIWLQVALNREVKYFIVGKVLHAGGANWDKLAFVQIVLKYHLCQIILHIIAMYKKVCCAWKFVGNPQKTHQNLF